MLFKEVIEMSCFCKTQCVGDLRNIPCTVFQQYLWFPYNAFGNDLESGFLRVIFYCTVQMIYMHI